MTEKVESTEELVLDQENIEEEPIEIDGEEENLEEDQQDETEEDNETEDSETEIDDDSKENEESEDEEVTVSIGDEDSPPEEETKAAPAWVKELRKTNRELKKQLREKDEKLKAVSGATETQPVELGKRPSIEDFDYDTEKFEEELSNWFERKHKVEEHKAKVAQEQQAQEKQWQERLNSYEESKGNLKVRDYEEAEFNAQESLSTTQQGMIVQGAENPALVIYALGKNSNKLKEISKIKDPVKFAFTVAKLETQLKVQSKKRPSSKPEKTIKGSTGNSGTVDSQLERLRSEAEKTGDYSKVIAYKNKLKSKK